MRKFSVGIKGLDQSCRGFEGFAFGGSRIFGNSGMVTVNLT